MRYIGRHLVSIATALDSLVVLLLELREVLVLDHLVASKEHTCIHKILHYAL